ncbi:MAG: imelysin family protein, partial [Bacteroidota bacterium]
SAAFTNCSGDKGPEQAAVVENYADLALDGYTQALEDAKDLRQTLADFTASPTEAGMEAARTIWLEARESYGPTEAFRFADGPIDVIDGEEGPEGLINAWPLDEAYVDYVEGAPDAGIINMVERYPDLEATLLKELNTAGGEENVSVGFHAIEFLLWGQDLSDPADKIPGQRPYTDFVDGGTAANQDRRRQYLMLTADLLVDDLQLLVDQWAQDGPYRKKFLAQETGKSITQMMTGIATLSKSELAGERVFTAYSNRDQEDEHSCFADNTHRDLRLNFEGIASVYFGGQDQESAINVHQLIAAADTEMATQIKDQFAAAREAVYATAIPFDHAISDNELRPDVLAAVQSLRTLGDLIVAGGTKIEVRVGTEL